MTKRCCKCKGVKEKSEFYKDSSRKDGYDNRCKPCRKELNREYSKNNRETILEKKRKYHKNNRETILEKKESTVKITVRQY